MPVENVAMTIANIAIRNPWKAVAETIKIAPNNNKMNEA